MRIILVEPEKSGNIGAIARSMKNFELNELWLVKPKAAIDNEALAFATHGRDLLKTAVTADSIDEALKGLDTVVATSSVAATSTTNLTRRAISPRQLAERIGKQRRKVGILFGRESSGLSNSELSKCDFMITIPSSRLYGVLNIASAASIIFYELFLSKKNADVDSASRPAKERLMSQFAELARQVGVQPHKQSLAERAFRSVISRSFISEREASLMIGVFRKACSSLM